MKEYICIARCPELDRDKAKHCVATKEEREKREERFGQFCYCGNRETWKELKDE